MTTSALKPASISPRFTLHATRDVGSLVFDRRDARASPCRRAGSWRARLQRAVDAQHRLEHFAVDAAPTPPLHARRCQGGGRHGGDRMPVIQRLLRASRLSDMSFRSIAPSPMLRFGVDEGTSRRTRRLGHRAPPQPHWCPPRGCGHARGGLRTTTPTACRAATGRRRSWRVQ